MIKGEGEESRDNLLIVGCGAIESMVPRKLLCDAIKSIVPERVLKGIFCLENINRIKKQTTSYPASRVNESTNAE